MKINDDGQVDSFKGPIFIIAVDRSGTTLLNLMLDTHPDIAMPYESKFITDFYRNGTYQIDYTNNEELTRMLENILTGRYVSRWDEALTLNDIDRSKCTNFPSTITAIYMAYARKKGKGIWGDKDPYYVCDVDILYKLFPHAKFIFLVRDGRDVALSIKEQWWGPNDFVNCLKYWEKMVLLSSKMLAMLPVKDVYHLRYEDLVLNPEQELRRVCSFLGVGYVANMSSGFSANAKLKVGVNRLKGQHSRLLEKPGKEHLYKWKRSLSKCDQAIAYEIAGKTLSVFGYEPGCKRHPLKIVRKIYHFLTEFYRYKFPRQIPSVSVAGMEK